MLLLRGWRALGDALLSGCDLSECQGVVFVLTSHANELPAPNSPWCTGFNSPPPPPPSPPSFLSPSPWITHSTERQSCPVLFTAACSACIIPPRTGEQVPGQALQPQQGCSLCSASAPTSVGWLLSVPQGPGKVTVRCGMVPLVCCVIHRGVCAPCCSSCWFAAVQWRHE